MSFILDCIVVCVKTIIGGFFINLGIGIIVALAVLAGATGSYLLNRRKP